MLEPKTLLQATELNCLLQNLKVQLLDCSLHLGDTIPKAEFLNWQGKPDRVSGCIEALDIRPTTYVVCYCKFGVEEAAQVWWVLKQLDFLQVSVLNGGLRAWREAQLSVSTSQPKLVEPHIVQIPQAEGLVIEALEHCTLLSTDDSLMLLKSLLTETKQLKTNKSTERPTQCIQ
jgi:3-mercaptopyruvate sulfurtransferase SseA